MISTPDFADSGFWIIKSTLRERCGEHRETRLTEIKPGLDMGTARLVCGAGIYRNDGLIRLPSAKPRAARTVPPRGD